MTGSPQDGGSPRGNLWAAGLLVVGLAMAVAVLRMNTPSGPTPGSSPSATQPVAQQVPPGAITKPTDTVFIWDEETARGEVYASGGFVLTPVSRPSDDVRAAALSVRTPDGKTVELVGAPSLLGGVGAEIGVGRIDPASTDPQVLFTTFSGGAHCCAVIKLLDFVGGSWRVLDIDTQDGDRLGGFPSDLDGDGKREFLLADRRFLYAFDSYAGSFAPPLIKSVEQGQVRDSSSDSRFHKVFDEYATRVQASCVEHQNAACAAFVAASARSGKVKAAWQIMLESYDRTFDWPLPSACRHPTPGTECPEADQITFGNYPEALRWFLGDAGYLPPVYIPADDSNPSFDCATVKAETLRLVCATPELAGADRELAWLYWRALAVSNAPEQIVEDERAFIGARNNAPADAFVLLRLYEARLSELRTLVE